MRAAPARLGIALVATLLAACGPSSTSNHPSKSSTPQQTGPAALAGSADWPTYHGDLARTGVLKGQSGPFQSASFGWASGPLDADVYASPLVAQGLVFIATENNTVYAYDAGGHQKWSQHLARPVDASTLPCGNVRPITGITGTPVVDPATSTLYAVAFVSPGQHVLYALDTSNGTIRSQRPIDPPRDAARTEQQRGALTLARGIVYVPYGGLLGDCGVYHGWIVGASAAGGDLISYQVPCRRECGLWAPGGPTVDNRGDLWVATGNSDSFTSFDYGNAVLHLSSALKLLDWFAPSNWADMSRGDQDLGSISPALLDRGLLWTSGKDGRGYLLQRDRLGQIGGQAFAGSACSTFGGTAVSGPDLYLACSNEVMSVRVNTSGPSFSIRWRRGEDSPGAPIVAFGALWVVETGSGRLAALDLADGHQLFSYAGGRAMHFVTPAASGNHIYAAVGRRLVAIRA